MRTGPLQAQAQKALMFTFEEAVSFSHKTLLFQALRQFKGIYDFKQPIVFGIFLSL
jgi:hypothetical protein